MYLVATAMPNVDSLHPQPTTKQTLPWLAESICKCGQISIAN